MPGWLDRSRNWLRGRVRKLMRLEDEIRESLVELDPSLVDDFLWLLLTVMSTRFWVDESYHDNIEGFRGKYLFQSKDGKIKVRAVFKPSWLSGYEYLYVRKGDQKNPDVTVTFRNPKAIMTLLVSPKLDVLQSILQNDVSVSGNLNYIFKFGFMATQLRQKLLPAT